MAKRPIDLIRLHVLARIGAQARVKDILEETRTLKEFLAKFPAIEKSIRLPDPTELRRHRASHDQWVETLKEKRRNIRKRTATAKRKQRAR